MKIKKKNEYCILCPGNDLGMFQIAEKIEENLVILKEQGFRKICVDLDEAPIIDSSVIGTLVRFYSDIVKEKGELIIISRRNSAVEAMLSMQLGRVIRFVDSEEDLK